MNHKRPSYHSGNSKGFRSSVLGTEDKHQIYMFYYTSIVQESVEERDFKLHVWILSPACDSTYFSHLPLVLLHYHSFKEDPKLRWYCKKTGEVTIPRAHSGFLWFTVRITRRAPGWRTDMHMGRAAMHSALGHSLHKATQPRANGDH